MAIWILLLLASTKQVFAQPPSIVLTAFEPFAGRSVNRSEGVAEVVARELTARGFEIRICTLPVVYDEAARVAERCIAEGPEPALVLSLGEGDCEIHVETLARNLDNTPHLPDNAGETRASKTIDPTLPARVTFSYPAAALSRAMAGSRLSKNMGNFVCNNTAFRLGTKFHGSQIQYGFIHVPPASCGKISDPERVGLNLTQSIISVNPFP